MPRSLLRPVRRPWLCLPLLLAAGCSTPTAPKAPAMAAAPAAVAAPAPVPLPDTRDQQVPGYYRQQIGDVRLTALLDGVVPLPRTVFKGLAPRRLESLLDRRYVPESDKGMQTAVNAYLIERGGQRVLIDAGTADCFGDSAGLGQVLRHLRASGFAPEDIDAVLITHGHSDHLCGVLDRSGQAAFPKATLWLARAEVDYWQDPKTEQSLPEAFRFIAGQTRKALSVYEQSGRLKRFVAGESLPGGVSVVATPGHTPGHTSYLVDGGGGQKVLVWGDVLHAHALQFASPEASFEVDVNRPQAVASRRAVLNQAARHGWWIAGAHLPFPGLGHTRAEGKGFVWVPAEFSPLPAAK